MLVQKSQMKKNVTIIRQLNHDLKIEELEDEFMKNFIEFFERACEGQPKASFGKNWRPSQAQKTASNRKKKVHSTTTLKEIKLRPRTEEHDLFFKIRNLKKFLANRSKIKISLQFRGREMAHIDLGEKMMARIVEEIKEVAVIEQGPRLEGRFMTMMVAPKP